MFANLGWLWAIIIGALAGFIAGKLMRGGGFGCLVNLVVGIIGALIGGWVFSLLGLAVGGSIIGSLVTATIGAVIFLWIISLFQRR